MSIEITHIRFSGTAKTHESIVRYKWRNLSTGNVGDNDTPSMVEWVGATGNEVFVGSNPTTRAQVGVVRPDDAPAYLRTYADGYYNNNLLSLDTF